MGTTNTEWRRENIRKTTNGNAYGSEPSVDSDRRARGTPRALLRPDGCFGGREPRRLRREKSNRCRISRSTNVFAEDEISKNTPEEGYFYQRMCIYTMKGNEKASDINGYGRFMNLRRWSIYRVCNVQRNYNARCFSSRNSRHTPCRIYSPPVYQNKILCVPSVIQ